MKKIFSIALGLAIVGALLSSCSKNAFEEKFYDPSKTTSVTCDKLMTGMFYVSIDVYKSYGYTAYWRLYTWEHHFAQLTQAIGYVHNSGSDYDIADSYATDRWNNFYELLANFRRMQYTYDNESEADQAKDKIFLLISEAFLYDNLAQIVDVFGPVPFTKAGYLGITGSLESSYAAYDSDEEIYTTMLSRLETIYSEIGAIKNNISASLQASLTAQDFINDGDLDKWQRYVNSLRLRLAVHVSAQGNLTSTGKSAATAAASGLLVTSLENATIGKVNENTAGGGFKFWEHYRDGFSGGDFRNAVASQPVIDAMRITGQDDPRLKIFYHPTENGSFKGLSVEESSADQNTNYTKMTEKWANRVYSTLDSVTFIGNGLRENYVMSPAEVYFLLAESYQQGYISGGDAKAAFKNGVKYSILQYYAVNMNSVACGNMSWYRHYKATTAPTDAEIDAYAEAVWAAYPNKLQAIMTQKWLHLWLLDAHESWTDIRRTGYPALDHPTDTQAKDSPNIRQRITYPMVEMNNNTANYNDAAAKVDNDSADYVLFWAKKVN